MNWTPQDTIRFHLWEIEYMRWKACERMGMHATPPPKPANYDLWKQGPDPLKLASTQPICCPGGGLVPDAWTSNAVPERLQDTPLYQPDLL